MSKDKSKKAPCALAGDVAELKVDLREIVGLLGAQLGEPFASKAREVLEKHTAKPKKAK